MNAKVNFQLSKPIPFYSTVDMLDAYSLAFETTIQLQTLINQISKSIAQIKDFALKNNISSANFFEIESLISISQHLSEVQSNTYDVDREKYQIELDSSSNQYDSGDLLNAYAIAHETTAWLQTMFHQIKQEFNVIKAKTTNLANAIFTNLERLIYIAEYLADNHTNTFDIEREKYEAEWETVKNG